VQLDPVDDDLSEVVVLVLLDDAATEVAAAAADARALDETVVATPDLQLATRAGVVEVLPDGDEKTVGVVEEVERRGGATGIGDRLASEPEP